MESESNFNLEHDFALFKLRNNCIEKTLLICVLMETRAILDQSFNKLKRYFMTLENLTIKASIETSTFLCVILFFK
jgi:hypothetical protein